MNLLPPKQLPAKFLPRPGSASTGTKLLETNASGVYQFRRPYTTIPNQGRASRQESGARVSCSGLLLNICCTRVPRNRRRQSRKREIQSYRGQQTVRRIEVGPPSEQARSARGSKWKLKSQLPAQTAVCENPPSRLTGCQPVQRKPGRSQKAFGEPS